MLDPGIRVSRASALNRSHSSFSSASSAASTSSQSSSTSSHGGSFDPSPPTGLGVRPGSAAGPGKLQRNNWMINSQTLAPDDDVIPHPSTFADFDQIPGGPNVPAPLYRQAGGSAQPSYRSGASARSGAWGSADMDSQSFASMQRAANVNLPVEGQPIGWSPQDYAEAQEYNEIRQLNPLELPPTPQGSVDLTSRPGTAVGGPSSFLPGAQQVSSRPPSRPPSPPVASSPTSSHVSSRPSTAPPRQPSLDSQDDFFVQMAAGYNGGRFDVGDGEGTEWMYNASAVDAAARGQVGGGVNSPSPKGQNTGQALRRWKDKAEKTLSSQDGSSSGRGGSGRFSGGGEPAE